MVDAASLVPLLAQTLAPHRDARRWWIACSGGVDSIALLHAVATLTRAEPGPWPALAALHINHGLNPNAAAWAHEVRTQCVVLGVECRVVDVAVDRDHGGGLEAAARHARYAAFESVLAAEEVLLQAHHGDDQSETFFLRLLRGAGLTGLTGMPAQRPLGRGLLMRPLLGTSRANLVAYARANGLRWCEDASNSDERLDRNFLRAGVLPRLAERWPGYRDTLLRAMAQLGEADDLLRQYAVAELATLQKLDGGLDGAALARLEPARQRLLLRHWLGAHGAPLPGRAQLDALRVMVSAAADAQPCVRWQGVAVRRFRQTLYLLVDQAAPLATFDEPWPPQEPFALADGGLLRAQPAVGQGLRADRSYRVRNRRGGERSHPLDRAHSQSLKKLLQEATLPPWWREHVPLICCGDEIAAVGDLWICRGYAAAPDMPGWLLQWRRPAIDFGG